MLTLNRHSSSWALDVVLEKVKAYIGSISTKDLSTFGLSSGHLFQNH